MEYQNKVIITDLTVRYICILNKLKLTLGNRHSFVMIYQLYVYDKDTYMPIAVCGKNLKVFFVTKWINIYKIFSVLNLIVDFKRKVEENHQPIVSD